MWSLVRYQSPNRLETVQTGGVLGLIMLTGIAVLFSPGGSQFFRFILWGAFFTVPVILTFFRKRTGKIWQAISIVMVVVFFLLSFPTFLAHNNHANNVNVYPVELAATGFMGRNYRSGNGLTVFEFPTWYATLLYDVPQAEIKSIPESIRIGDKADAWDYMGRLLTSFESLRNRSLGGQLFCFFEKRAKGDLRFWWGVEPTDPAWNELEGRLATANNIYNNGSDVNIYAP